MRVTDRRCVRPSSVRVLRPGLKCGADCSPSAVARALRAREDLSVSHSIWPRRDGGPEDLEKMGREGGGKKSKGAGLEGEGRVERRLGYSLTPLWMSSIALEVKINGEIRHRTDRTSILDEVDLKCYRIAKDQRHVGCR